METTKVEYPNCINLKHRFSPIGWHYIDKNTTKPVVICYDCGRMLSNREIMLLDLMDMIQGNRRVL